MEDLRTWALMLVFLALSSFIYYYLLPSGRISDSAKSLLSVLTVAAVCLPVFGVISGEVSLFPGFSDEKTESFEPCSYYAELADKTITEKVSLIVKEHTDVPFLVETDIHIAGELCIDINQVSVIFEKKPDNLPELSQKLEQELGMTPHFVLKETNDDKETDSRKTAE